MKSLYLGSLQFLLASVELIRHCQAWLGCSHGYVRMIVYTHPTGCSTPDVVLPIFVLGFNQIWGTLNHFKVNCMSFYKREGTKPCSLNPSEDQRRLLSVQVSAHFSQHSAQKYSPAFPSHFCKAPLLASRFLASPGLSFSWFLCFPFTIHQKGGVGPSPSTHGGFVRGCLCSEQGQGSLPRVVTALGWFRGHHPARPW